MKIINSCKTESPDINYPHIPDAQNIHILYAYTLLLKTDHIINTIADPDINGPRGISPWSLAARLPGSETKIKTREIKRAVNNEYMLFINPEYSVTVNISFISPIPKVFLWSSFFAVSETSNIKTESIAPEQVLFSIQIILFPISLNPGSENITAAIQMHIPVTMHLFGIILFLIS